MHTFSRRGINSGIFDEVQTLEKHDGSYFWKVLKDAIDTTGRENVKILCLAGYGSRSLRTTCSAPIQFFSGNEFISLCDNVTAVTNITLSDTVRGVLWKNTKALRTLLTSVDGYQLVTESRTLAGLRSFALEQATRVRTTNQDQTVSELVRAGYITNAEVKSYVMFSCPLIAHSTSITFNSLFLTIFRTSSLLAMYQSTSRIMIRHFLTFCSVLSTKFVSANWGIEFLLAGNKRDEHLQRFDTQGVREPPSPQILLKSKMNNFHWRWIFTL